MDINGKSRWYGEAINDLYTEWPGGTEKIIKQKESEECSPCKADSNRDKADMLARMGEGLEPSNDLNAGKNRTWNFKIERNDGVSDFSRYSGVQNTYQPQTSHNKTKTIYANKEIELAIEIAVRLSESDNKTKNDLIIQSFIERLERSLDVIAILLTTGALQALCYKIPANNIKVVDAHFEQMYKYRDTSLPLQHRCEAALQVLLQLKEARQELLDSGLKHDDIYFEMSEKCLLLMKEYELVESITEPDGSKIKTIIGTKTYTNWFVTPATHQFADFDAWYRAASRLSSEQNNGTPIFGRLQTSTNQGVIAMVMTKFIGKTPWSLGTLYVKKATGDIFVEKQEIWVSSDGGNENNKQGKYNGMGLVHPEHAYAIVLPTALPAPEPQPEQAPTETK